MRWWRLGGLVVLVGRLGWAGEPVAPGEVRQFEPLSVERGPGLMVARPRSGAPAVATTADPELGWRYRSSLPAKRSAHVVAAVGNKVYVIGGWDGTAVQNTVSIYDPATDTWSTGFSMPTARSRMAAAVVGTRIYVLGGSDGSNTLATVEAYDTVTNSWVTGFAAMPTARRELAAAVVGTTVYAVGGATGSLISGTVGFLGTTEALNTLTTTWSTLAPMPTARASAGATASGKFCYLAGGDVSASAATASVERYDTEGNSWSPVSSLSSARDEVTLVAIRGLLYGGGGGTPSPSVYFSEWQRYDPGTNAWGGRTRMQTARFDSGGAVVNDRIYIVGGHDGAVNLASVEEGGGLAAPEALAPVGGQAVYTGRPTFSWRFVSPYAGESQGGYDVVTTTSPTWRPAPQNGAGVASPASTETVWARTTRVVGSSGTVTFVDYGVFGGESSWTVPSAKWRLPEGTWYWWGRAVDQAKAWGDNWAGPISFRIGTSEAVTVGPNVVKGPAVRTTIRYTLDRPQAVTVKIFSAAGDLVTTLVEGASQGGANGGEFSATWDGTNEATGRVASGVYHVLVTGEGWKQIRKLVVIR